MFSIVFLSFFIVACGIAQGSRVKIYFPGYDDKYLNNFKPKVDNKNRLFKREYLWPALGKILQLAVDYIGDSKKAQEPKWMEELRDNRKVWNSSWKLVSYGLWNNEDDMNNKGSLLSLYKFPTKSSKKEIYWFNFEKVEGSFWSLGYFYALIGNWEIKFRVKRDLFFKKKNAEDKIEYMDKNDLVILNISPEDIRDYYKYLRFEEPKVKKTKIN